MNNTRWHIVLILTFLLLCVGVILPVLFSGKKIDFKPSINKKMDQTQKNNSSLISNGNEFVRFSSEQEVRDYLNKSRSSYNVVQMGGLMSRSALPSAAFGGDFVAEKAMPERYSSTNVQVKGIDEADIVKTDGKSIFYSQEQTHSFFTEPQRVTDWVGEATMPIRYPVPPKSNGVKLMSAFPLKEVSLKATLQISGEMLLSNSSLVVINSNSATGFDVSDIKSPAKLWSYTLDSDVQIVANRLLDNKVYLVLKKFVNYSTPCPYYLFASDKTSQISCTDIYHPASTSSVDSIYTIMVLDPSSGKKLVSTSFIGSSDYNNSVVYMSPNALYISYSTVADMTEFMFKFFQENSDFVGKDAVLRLEKLRGYDLSSEAKMVELQRVFAQLGSSKLSDEKIKFENMLNNKISLYTQKHIRELDKTGIAKISVDSLSFMSYGEIPGRLVNQFAMDEYDGFLRVASTVGNSWLGFGSVQTASFNGIYILDKNMMLSGKLEDLGLTERIYSARFVGSKAYVVTFRQVDPFYVIDLKDAKNPLKTGELKIPGFSSYLHPLSDNLILGVGQENFKTKLSLFDVSDPFNPVEVDKNLLTDSWTEVSSNHHAFTHDRKNGIFFLPGGNNAYVFSYKNSSLTLEKALAGVWKRALYINDYLYVLSDNSMVVLDQNNWQQVKRLDL